MAVPWLQIIQLVPSILDMSRELLKKSRQPPPVHQPHTPNDTAERVAALEENERRQAELVAQMAEQIATLSNAVTALHGSLRKLALAAAIAVAIATGALVVALR
jgi:hypothetical protein